MSIIPHAYYRDLEQARRRAWQLRKWQHERDGKRPPLSWVDDQETEAEKEGIGRVMACLARKLKA